MRVTRIKRGCCSGDAMRRHAAQRGGTFRVGEEDGARGSPAPAIGLRTVASIDALLALQGCRGPGRAAKARGAARPQRARHARRAQAQRCSMAGSIQSTLGRLKSAAEGLKARLRRRWARCRSGRDRACGSKSNSPRPHSELIRVPFAAKPLRNRHNRRLPRTSQLGIVAASAAVYKPAARGRMLA